MSSTNYPYRCQFRNPSAQQFLLRLQLFSVEWPFGTTTSVFNPGYTAILGIEGRHDLLGTSFDTFEQNIRGQLGAMLGAGGFDPARDIKAITVNRWPHGYAVGYDYETGALNWYSDPWPDERKLWLKGRQRFGLIAMANSDAGASAMTEGAIKQGYRVAHDLL